MEAGIHTITNTTLMRMNADGIEQTIEFLHDLGDPHLCRQRHDLLGWWV